MNRRLIIRPLALTELEDLARYVARDSLDAADPLRSQTVRTMQDLLHSPQRQRVLYPEHPTFHDVRRVHPSGFPNHAIFYRVTDETVEVLRVLHLARDLPSALAESDRPG